jgi:putative transposase
MPDSLTIWTISCVILPGAAPAIPFGGKSKKKVTDKDGQLEISVARDRQVSFEPKLIKKGQSRIPGFNDKVISKYARGMTVREIQGHLKDVYVVEVSPDLISKVTSAVMDEVRQWQTRPLEPVYPVVIFDALRIKIRDEDMVKNKAIYVALGIKVVLGLWVEQTEGAKFWMRVMTELKNRGGSRCPHLKVSI